MSDTKPFNQSELMRLALAGLDTQIAELQEKRAQLAALTSGQPAAPSVEAAPPPQKTGKMSDEARAKISAAAKKRWAKVKKAKAEAAKSAPAAKKTPAKKTAVTAETSSTKRKKAPAKKGKSKTLTATETGAANAE